MKVMLIQPPSSTSFMDKVFMYEPLGLEYLGAGLKEDGHEVLLLDARLEPDFETAFCSFQPDIVGITGYTNHLTIVKDMAMRCKRINPDVYVVVGGHHATVSPKDYNIKAIDVVVLGEGVFTLREVIKHWMGGSADLEAIPGLAIPGSKMKFTKKRPYTTLDALPFPERSLTSRYRNEYFSDWMKPIASIRTSLGCFGDKLADLIKEAGIKKKYFLYGRVDTIVKHPELFVKWKKIGLTQVLLGLKVSQTIGSRH